MNVDPKRVVADGYDVIFERYEQWDDDDRVRDRWLDAVLPLVPSRAAALDLGCGTGTKATVRLAREFESVVAVDISPGGSSRRGRVLLFNVGLHAGDGGDDDWLGVPMYWSGLGQDGTVAAVDDAGLVVLDVTTENIVEQGGDATFLWVTARKPR